LEFVDSMLGELLDHLKQVGIYDEALIILAADHGVSFRPDDYRRRATETNYADLMPVPLLVKCPLQARGEISDRNVETIDLLPTIVQVLGAKVPWKMDGCSAFDKNAVERKNKVMLGLGKRTDIDASFEEKYEAVDRKLALFGSGKDPLGLYRLGPHRDLVGRPVTEMGIASTADAEISVDQSAFLSDYNLAGAFVPAHLSGTVRSNAVEADCVAIAVNGLIAGVDKLSYDEFGTATWSVFAPEMLFKAENNDVRVYLVTEVAGQLALLDSPQEKQDLSCKILAAGDENQRLVFSDGRQVKVQSKRSFGAVGFVRLDDPLVRCRGWAADMGQGAPVDSVLIFLDGECRFRCNMDRDGYFRPRVGQLFKQPHLTHVGFRMALPADWFADQDPSTVQFFAIRGDEAGELRPVEDFWKLPPDSESVRMAQGKTPPRR
jgi:hypothetical protein